MGPKILAIGTVSLLLGTMFIGMFWFVEEVEASPDDWIERFIVDVVDGVNVVAIGDADNDGYNEVVIGMAQSANEIRMYKKIAGVWIEDVIAHLGIPVRSIAIGDADNDGFNEVVAGTELTSGELQIFKKEAGKWVTQDTKNTPNVINSVAIGDADNDSNNEIIIGLNSDTDEEVRAYKYNYASNKYDESLIVELSPIDVNAVAIGDADNDGNNEIVIGIDDSENEVRAYENITGVWVQDNITTLFGDVWSVTIGDANNDGFNEVVVGGILGATSQVWAFNKSGIWEGDYIDALPSEIESIAIGDAESDDKNEVIIGLHNAMNAVRMYKYVSKDNWNEHNITDVPVSVLSVAMGDPNNDGNNEVVIGMENTTNEVRIYALDKGQIIFTSHTNGDYVSGTTTFEILATSNFVDSVKFYVNDEPKFTDSSSPYQYILDTTGLMEDTIYTIKAEGLRNNAPPLIATVDVIVNNVVQFGDYIIVSTLKPEYGPDQEVSVVVSTKSPPSYGSLNLVVSYTDPTGNTMSKTEESLPSTTQYIVILPLSSDAALGTYTVTANAYGYDGEVMIWEASNGTTFNVSGKSLQEQLADLYAQHDVLNNSITSLSDVIENEHEFSRSEILDRINASITEFQGLDDIINDHDSEIKGVLDSLNNLVENEHNLTKTELLDELAEVLNQLQGVDDDVTSEVTDVKTTLADLDTDLASTKDDIKSVSEAQDLYAMIAIVLLIIALLILIIGMFLTFKANKMLKGLGGGPGMGMPIEEKMEPEVEEAPYEPETVAEEPPEIIDEIVEEVEEKPKKKSGRGKKKK